MQVRIRGLWAVLCGLLAGFTAGGFTGAGMLWAEEPVGALAVDKTPVDFVSQVHPLLTKYCLGCHSGAEPEGSVRLDQAAALLTPGDDQRAAVVPGKSQESLLIQLVTGAQEPKMPPDGEPVPTADEIAMLTRWIDQGAAIPEHFQHASLQAPAIPLRGPERNPVYSSAWSPDGQRIAVGKQGSVEVWQAAENQQLFQAADCTGAVTQVQFSPDGKRLYVTGGEPALFGELRCFDASTGQLQWTSRAHADAIYSLAVNPAGDLVATGSYDRSIVLWEAATGKQLATLAGHHGGVNSLDFHPRRPWLASASDDKTVKLWDVVTRERIATLSEPAMAQASVRFHPDGKLLAAAGQDKRIRVWEIEKRLASGNPPILYTRFAHDAPILAIAFSPSGKYLLSAAEDQACKVWDARSFTQLQVLSRDSDWVAGLAVSVDPPRLLAAQLDGRWTVRPLELRAGSMQIAEPLDLLPTPPSASPLEITRPSEVAEQEPNDHPQQAQQLTVPSKVSGVIDGVGEQVIDLYRFSAQQGKSLILETSGARIKSPVDTKLEILTPDGEKLQWLKLQAIRDSYITFRPIDSTINGLRMHNWEEIRLKDYIYLGGEVIRVEQLPRGPDADFRFFAQGNKRRAYFGMSGLAHALEDPIYVVQPYAADAEFVENGLPVFPIYFENDDEETQQLGVDSRLLFIPPADGEYLVRVTDVRGFASPEHRYELTIRPAQPDFAVTLATREMKIPRGSGRSLTVQVVRQDGFEGDVSVTFEQLPPGLEIASPVVIEAGHLEADTVVYAAEDAVELTPGQIEGIVVKATTSGLGEPVTKPVAGLQKLELIPTEKVRLHFLADVPDRTAADSSDAPRVLTIAPGETINTLLQLERLGFEGELRLDVKNLPHGIIVDNIGLSGVLVRQGEQDRPIFLTAADWVKPQDRWIHAVTLGQGDQATRPVLLKVRQRPERVVAAPESSP